MTTRTAAKSKLLDAEIAVETEAVSQIDWKRRWEQKVSDEIENKAKYSAKLAEAQLDLDKARKQIKDLEKMVRDLTPTQAKLDRERDERRKADVKWADQIKDKDAKIEHWKTLAEQGQRGAIESVIAWLQRTADKLPEPVRAEEIDFDPPTAEVFS